MEINIIRTDSSNPHFQHLVNHLDKYLAYIDGDEHGFYAQFNNIDVLRHTVVLYQDNLPGSCGAFKALDDKTAEIKRMYTITTARGKGLASRVLHELECWAKDLGYTSCKLETGKRMAEAVNFYRKQGYRVVPNYGQYEGIENSICFEKSLST